MDKIEDNFMSTLKILLKEYSNCDNNKDVEKLIKVFTKLDYKKLAKKIFDRVGNEQQRIEGKDETIFCNSFCPLPGVDISKIWKDLTDKKKEKFWVSLNIVVSYAEMVVTYDELENKMKDSGLNFNPFEGIKGGNLDTDGIKDALGEINVAGSGLERLGKLMGGQNLDNLEQLTDQLKNMTDEDIDKATKTIKNMFGEQSNDMEEMLKIISAELKSGKSLGDGDLMTTLNSVAESVAKKMAPKIESGQVNGDKLFQSTQNLMNKMIPEKEAQKLMKQFDQQVKKNDKK
uniref:Uncharacterized protein n=1 Tax=viral metagenome TaxID=1070528 RepID=A0A6C0AC17_9ZZZZ